jgi:hypothetical protein
MDRRKFFRLGGIAAAATVVPVVAIAAIATSKPQLPKHELGKGKIGSEEWNAVIDRLNELSR